MQRSFQILGITLILNVMLTVSRAGNIFDDDYVPPSSKAPTTAATQPATRSVPETIKPVPEKPTAGKEVAPKLAIEPVPPAANRAPLPVPAPSDQSRSRMLFKETFADELKDRSVAGRRALADLLLAQADKVKGNPSDQYVLLIGARDAAAEGGDLRLAARAADLTAEAYDVTALRLKTDVALNHSIRADSPAATAENCRAAIELLDALVTADDYATAAQLLAAIQPIAVDPTLVAPMQARAKQLALLRGGQKRVTTAMERLKRTPGDPAASYVIGSVLCFVKGDWDHGLPLLAASDNPTIKAAAVADLATKDAADQQVTTGDAWWIAANKEVFTPNAIAMRQRAANWYAKALSGTQITGLSRLRLEKRIATVPEAAISAVTAPFLGVLLFVGNNAEKDIFGPISRGRLRVVTHGQIPDVLAAPREAFENTSVIVWGRNVFREIPEADITDSVQQALQKFVRDGGDLVFFEQFAMGNMDIVQKLFGVKVSNDARGAQIVDPELKARAEAVGLTDASLKDVRFYNSYLELPKNATALIRGGNNDHPATGVIVPYFRGRLIMIATNMDKSDVKLDEEFFDVIYHYKSVKPAGAAGSPAVHKSVSPSIPVGVSKTAQPPPE